MQNDGVESSIKAQAVDSQMVFESHQVFFDMLIERLPASAKLLARIKLEYETVLRKITRSRNNVVTRAMQDTLLSTEMITLSNYHKRMNELEVKSERIRADNMRMQRELDGMRQHRNQLMADYKDRLDRTKLKSNIHTNSRRRTNISLPLNEATCASFLQKHLLKVEAKLLETKDVTEKKYVPAQRKSQLQDHLKAKEKSRNQLGTENKTLTDMLRRLKIGVKAVESYYPYLKEKGIDPTSFPIDNYITVVIDNQPGLDDEILSDEDPEDPAKDMEAEMVLDCYEKFNELFESEKYEEAALHAATSPKGVLRTLKTLHLFKSSARHQVGKKLPLLSYCEFLLQCAPAFRPISLEESIECSKCILAQGEINKLIHWIAQGSMPSSAELGNLIFKNCSCPNKCKCGHKNLAFTVFDHSQSLNQAALCLMQQGKFMHFLSYAAKARLPKKEYMEILCTSPNAKFAVLLMSPPEPHQPLFGMFELMQMLLERGKGEDAVRYLHAYLTKSGISLVQAVMKDDRINPTLLGEITWGLCQAGLEETALDLVSSWTVRCVVERSILALNEESNQFQSTSSISDTNSEISSQSGSSYESVSTD